MTKSSFSSIPILYQKSHVRQIPLTPCFNFIGWAIKIARYKTLSHFRDQSRDRHVFDPEIMELLADSAAEIMEKIPQRQLALKSCINKLTSDQQGILRARYFQGKSVREVADLFNRTDDGIKSLMRRVRNTLRQCIDNELKQLNS
jgi:RNA polymerase sigma-70 factor (ECF subfamily)